MLVANSFWSLLKLHPCCTEVTQEVMHTSYCCLSQAQGMSGAHARTQLCCHHILVIGRHIMHRGRLSQAVTCMKHPDCSGQMQMVRQAWTAAQQLPDPSLLWLAWWAGACFSFRQACKQAWQCDKGEELSFRTCLLASGSQLRRLSLVCRTGVVRHVPCSSQFMTQEGVSEHA